MPYKAVGQVKNATSEAAVHLSAQDGEALIRASATRRRAPARVILTVNLYKFI